MLFFRILLLLLSCNVSMLSCMEDEEARSTKQQCIRVAEQQTYPIPIALLPELQVPLFEHVVHVSASAPEAARNVQLNAIQQGRLDIIGQHIQSKKVAASWDAALTSQGNPRLAHKKADYALVIELLERGGENGT